MKFSDQVRAQATEFVSVKGQKILHTRRIPQADVGRAWMVVNELESGYIDGDVILKLKQLKNACVKDPDLEVFWNNNAKELEAALLAENV